MNVNTGQDVSICVKGVRVPRVIAMPDLDVVPLGPHREFLESLHQHYRQASRPQLRLLSETIAKRDLAGMPSRETIRRLLRGETIPEWLTVHAVINILCEFAGHTFDERGRSECEGVFHTKWNAALDGQTQAPAVTVRPAKMRNAGAPKPATTPSGLVRPTRPLPREIAFKKSRPSQPPADAEGNSTPDGQQEHRIDTSQQCTQ